MPPYVDDNGYDSNGGVIDGIDISPTQRTFNYNDNVVADGAIVSGKSNVIQSGNGVIIVGNNNFVSNNNQNVSILASSGITVYPSSNNISVTTSSGVTILSGVSNVSVTNSSGITVTESNVTYDNGIKTYNNVSYKKYIALLNQTGTNDPTATVLENTLSSGITWSRSTTGEYEGTLTGEFTNNKTFVLITLTQSGQVLAGRKTDNKVQVYTFTDLGVAIDGYLTNASIEIRVYS